MAKTNIWIDGSQAGATLRELQKEYNKIAREIKGLSRNSEEYKTAVGKMADAKQALNQHRNQVNGISDSYTKATSSIGGMMKQFAPMAIGISAITTAVSGLFGAVTSGIKSIAKFDTAMADLKAVTGANGESMDLFGQKAIEFSTKYGESAADIATAFKLAGSARPELLKNADAMATLTEQAIILSKASGDDVPTSISNLAGTLNAFNLPASKATEVMDTLANAAQLGVQEIPYLTEAFGKFGGVAAQAGVGVAESAAAVEILGKKIKEPATAGTNMRGILTKLQIAAQENGRSFKGLTEELNLMGSKVKDVTFLKKTFGEENLLAAQTLIAERGELAKLATQYNVTGTAQEQARINSNTINEAWNRLTQTFANQFLEIRNSSSGIIKALDWMSNNFDTIIKWVGKAIQIFATFKITMGAMKLMDRAKEWANLSFNVKKSSDAMNEVGNSAKSAGSGAKAFGAALKGIGFSVAITVLVDIGKALWDIASGAKQARKDLAKLEQQVDASTKKADKIVGSIQKNLEKKISDYNLALKKQGITGIEFQKKSTEFAKQQNEIAKERIKNLLAETNERAKSYKEQLAQLNSLKKLSVQDLLNNPNAAKQVQEYIKTFGSLDNAIGSYKAKLSGTYTETKKYTAENEALNLTINDVTGSVIDLENETKTLTKEEKKQLKSQQTKYKSNLDDLNNLIKKTIEYRAELDNAKNVASITDPMKKELADAEFTIKQKYEKEIEIAKKLSQEKGKIGTAANAQLSKLEIIQQEDLERKKKEITDKYAKIKLEQDQENGKNENLLAIQRENSLEDAIVQLKAQRAEQALLLANKNNIEQFQNARKEYDKAQEEQLKHSLIREKENLADQYSDGVISHEEYLLRKKALEEKYTSDVEKLHKTSAEVIAQTAQERFEQTLDAVKSIMADIAKLDNVNSQNKIKQLDRDQKKEMELLDEKLANKTISEQQYQAQKEAIEKESEEKKRKIQNEQAQRNKSAAIIEAMINGALAVSKVTAQTGVAAPFAIPIILASTAANIAAISMQDVEQYKEGGYTDVVGKKDGLRYRAKNVGRLKGGVTPRSASYALISEDGPEYFVPNRLMSDKRVANHVAIIEAIRTNQYAEGGYTNQEVGNSSDILEIIRNNTLVMSRLSQQIPNIKAVVDEKQSTKIVDQAQSTYTKRGY